jgi:hypothetical protein
MIIRMHHINAGNQLRLSHTISIKESCSRTSEKCANCVGNYQLSSCHAFCAAREDLTDAQGDRDGGYTGVAVPFKNVRSGVGGRSITISVV